MHLTKWHALAAATLVSLVIPLRTAAAQGRGSSAPDSTSCTSCAEWNAPHPPVRIFGNTWFVGTNGLTSLLITSPDGHILVDGALPQSADQIAANIRALGFRLEDVKVIVNSHVHWDHAGGIAQLQRLTSAEVPASRASAPVLASGKMSADDPQFGIIPDIQPVARVRVIGDGDTVRVGTLFIVAHATPGHTPGGTSWSWTSCEARDCRAIVYGDSQSAISADNFLFTKSSAYPTALTDFEKAFAYFERAACDILITPHPGASELWERLAKRDAGTRGALVDSSACRRYASGARDRLAKRVAEETAKR